MAHFTNLQFSKAVFGAFLGFTTFTCLSMYRPRYATWYCFAKVKRV